MPERCPLRLVPLGADVEVPRGARLDEVLAPYGVEFPCGGWGRCRGCRVRVLEGSIPITQETEAILSGAELEAGLRLACQARVEQSLTLEIAQWEMPVLADYPRFSIEPAEGTGIAVDVGTTTLAAQLLDLASGEVLAVESALNPQCAYGYWRNDQQPSDQQPPAKRTPSSGSTRREHRDASPVLR